MSKFRYVKRDLLKNDVITIYRLFKNSLKFKIILKRKSLYTSNELNNKRMS